MSELGELASLDRYSRQMRFPGIGTAGQRRLVDSRVTLCGCGALGTVLANALVRAGVGHLRLIDRDFVETSNLQRQVLFDESDVAENFPRPRPRRASWRRSIRRFTSSRSSPTSIARISKNSAATPI